MLLISCKVLHPSTEWKGFLIQSYLTSKSRQRKIIYFKKTGPLCRHFYCYLKSTPSGRPNVQTPLLGVTSGYSLKHCNPDPCEFEIIWTIMKIIKPCFTLSVCQCLVCLRCTAMWTSWGQTTNFCSQLPMRNVRKSAHWTLSVVSLPLLMGTSHQWISGKTENCCHCSLVSSF